MLHSLLEGILRKWKGFFVRSLGLEGSKRQEGHALVGRPCIGKYTQPVLISIVLDEDVHQTLARGPSLQPLGSDFGRNFKLSASGFGCAHPSQGIIEPCQPELLLRLEGLSRLHLG